MCEALYSNDETAQRRDERVNELVSHTLPFLPSTSNFAACEKRLCIINLILSKLISKAFALFSLINRSYTRPILPAIWTRALISNFLSCKAQKKNTQYNWWRI